MDGSHQQDNMAKQIKAQIKENAESRRERQYIRVMPIQREEVSLLPDLHDGSREETKSSSRIQRPRSLEPVPIVDTTAQSSPLFPTEIDSSTNSIIDPVFGSMLDDMDIDFEMTFLDHVFPFLFPFYRPSIFEGGRSWLLATLKSSRPLYYSAMSLSTYFFTSIMTYRSEAPYQTCKGHIWRKLASHVDTAIKAMQQETEGLMPIADEVSIFRKAQIMEGIVQLLIVGIRVARMTEWDVHLVAAISVFEEICNNYGIRDGKPAIMSVLTAMERISWPIKSSSTTLRVWNIDQGAFRFFTAVILYIDIVSSTALETPPRLQKYHPHLVANGRVIDYAAGALRLEDFVGCQSWVLLLVGDIATLAARRKTGSVSDVELISEETKLSRNLRKGISGLRDEYKGSHKDTPTSFLGPYESNGIGSQKSDSLLHTLIWAHAAEIYLSIVTSGWQRENHIVRENVQAALNLLQEVSSPAMLCNLAWPFCVVGCLATECQKQVIRELLSRMGSLIAFGTLQEALAIMERVWQLGEHVEDGTWDLARCLRILGTKALLI